MRHPYVTTSLVIAGLAASGLALAGCGGGQPAAPAAGRVLAAGGPQHWPADRNLAGMHACTLIPAAVIAQTLGQLEEPPTESADGLSCFYNTRASSENAGPSYILDILRRSLYEVAKTAAESEAKVRLIHVASVNGMGDEGFATSDTAGGPVYNLSVAKGGVAVAIQMDSVQPADEQRADRLVAAAMARL
jgi:hypothetical protein